MRHAAQLFKCTLIGGLLCLAVTGCGAATVQMIPTAQPTTTPTSTLTQQPTRSTQAPPSPTPTNAPPTVGPSPTPLFGPTRTPSGDALAPTRVLNPNAPRIEYFSTNVTAVEPGGNVTLFWSARGVDSAAIYQLDAQGQPSLVYNVRAAGNQVVTINRRLRGEARFVLAVGEGTQRVEQPLTIPVTCPVTWFFQPAPSECPNDAPQETQIVEQQFERGRLIYLASTNRVYALFNDGREPRWRAYENRYDPAIHADRDENFERALIGTGFVQAVGRLGFLWRGNDDVRNRLGNGLEPEISSTGFIQTAPTSTGGVTGESLYISSSSGTVIQLLPQNGGWQIFTPG